MNSDNYDQYFRVCVQCDQRKHISEFRKWRKQIKDHLPCNQCTHKNYKENPKNNLQAILRNYNYKPIIWKR